MYIITDKETNRIVMVGSNLDYMPNGYPRLVDENIAFVPNSINIYETDVIPPRVESEKYCYTPQDGFYPNPNWEEPNPYNIPNEVYNSIIDEYTNELIEMGVL